jgi:5-methylcytosine-specific restriction endonuclease McrA
VANIEIVRREKYKCLVCGNRGDDVHEIIPRSALPGKANEEILFSPRNQCFLCRTCHSNVHTVWGRCMLLGLMRLRYGYKYDELPFRAYFKVRTL